MIKKTQDEIDRHIMSVYQDSPPVKVGMWILFNRFSALLEQELTGEEMPGGFQSCKEKGWITEKDYGFSLTQAGFDAL